jgi:hypothetical protein
LLAARLLEQVGTLTVESSAAEVARFTDATSLLKAYTASDIAALSHEQTFAFFVNIMHTLVLHGFLLLGPPHNTITASSFFNAISYECAGDVFSVAELEHLILRAPLSKPTVFGASLFLPDQGKEGRNNYAYGAVANGGNLRPEKRFNFVLTCGSPSSPTRVQILNSEPAALEAQLVAAAAEYLDLAVTVNASRKPPLVVLPKVCSWYRNDFSTTGSPTQLLSVICGMLTQGSEKQRQLMALLDQQQQSTQQGKSVRAISIKYSEHSWGCQRFTCAPAPWLAQVESL